MPANESPSAASDAVRAALACDWKSAKKINEKLLSLDPNDIDCLNRLGKALLELGEKKKAITIFRKILKINQYDSIARKNLERAMTARIVTSGNDVSIPLATNFIEEPGKTKLITLVNLAPPSTLLKQNYGDKIKLAPKRHRVSVFDLSGTYLGSVPDDLGHRLAILIKAGNQYDGLIKSVSKNSVIVFLREMSRAKKFRHLPSFPASGSDYFSFVREETIGSEEKANVSSGEEESEQEGPSSRLHADEEEG
jgi:tetratricopeptide (TPR) repeat protein